MGSTIFSENHWLKRFFNFLITFTLLFCFCQGKQKTDVLNCYFFLSLKFGQIAIVSSVRAICLFCTIYVEFVSPFCNPQVGISMKLVRHINVFLLRHIPNVSKFITEQFLTFKRNSNTLTNILKSFILKSFITIKSRKNYPIF